MDVELYQTVITGQFINSEIPVEVTIKTVDKNNMRKMDEFLTKAQVLGGKPILRHNTCSVESTIKLKKDI